MTMVEGVAEMILAERPFMRPQGPSSAISCLKVRMMEFLPSTCKGQHTGEGRDLQSKPLCSMSLCLRLKWEKLDSGVGGLNFASEGRHSDSVWV